MPQIENIGSLELPRRPGETFRQAIAVRAMLEKAWDSRTAYQGITLADNDPISRGQCGVSNVWFGRFLQQQGVDTRFVEGKIYVKNHQVGDDHVWVEAHGISEQPLIIDITSDQYATIFGTPVHMGQYGDDGIIGRYTPEQSFDPSHLPHKKLMARFALLEQNIASLPRRHRLIVPKSKI